jgi:HIV Tat-specific factor 1
VNCAVYVTSIPLDATMEEINTVFKKFGLITEEIDTGKPRIKMYEDEAGNFKGDALVVYFRSESVDIAIQMLDETDFRYGVTGPDGPMRVQAADAAWKSDEANQPDQNQKQSTRSKTDQRKIAERAKRFNEYVISVQLRGCYADFLCTGNSAAGIPKRRTKSTPSMPTWSL